MNYSNRTLLLIHLLIAQLVLCSCAYDVANRYYLDYKLPEKKYDDVQVLWVKPDRDFVVIADFQSRGESERAKKGVKSLLGSCAVN